MIYSLHLILLSCSTKFLMGSPPEPEPEPNKWFNRLLDYQNPSSVWPPKTDNGNLAPFKYPFTFVHNEVDDGGWVREMSARELPISVNMSGRNTRTQKGAIGGLHWHIESEWAYVIYGHGRIASIDEQGRSFVDDVKGGDIWLFQGGRPHSVQGLGPDGLLHVTAFNGGLSFFRLEDWLKYTPRDVLAKNFQTQESTFDNLREEVTTLFRGELPNSLEADRLEASQLTGEVPQSFKFCTSSMNPNVTRSGGQVKIVDARNFPVTDIAAAIVTLKPSAMREMHWHPNADEWQYYIQGRARMTVFGLEGAARTMNLEEGDVGYVQKSFGHYIENICNETLIFMEVFPTPFYEDISLTQWLAHTPSKLVNQHIRTGVAFINSLPKDKLVVVP